MGSDATAQDAPADTLGSDHCLHGVHRRLRPAKGAAAGCDAFLTKPCLPDDLITEIWRVLGAAASPTKSA